MPQVQVLPGVPGFGSQLGAALGGGLGQGIAAGVQQGISSQLNEMLRIKKGLARVPSATTAISKRYAKDAFSPEKLFEIEKTAQQLVLEGLDPGSAASAAFQLNDMMAQQQSENPEQGTITQKALGKSAKPKQESKLDFGFGETPFSSQKGVEGEGFIDRSLRRIKEIPSQFGFTAPTLEDLKQIPKEFGGGTVEGATLGIINPDRSENLTKAGEAARLSGQVFGSLYGAPAKILGAFNKLLKPAGLLANIGVDTAAGATISSIEQLAHNGEIDLKQLGIDAASWGGIGLLFHGFPSIMRVFKGPVEKVAAQTGQKASQVFEKAVKNSGASVEQVLEGNSGEINKVKREISVIAKEPAIEGKPTEVESISKKVQEAPKAVHNKEQAIKEREVFGAKLPESPLEEYFAIEQREAHKLASKKPETLAKEAEITARAKPLEQKKYAELSEQKDSLKRLESELKKVSEKDKPRVDALAAHKRNQVQKTLDELKDLQYELKYFRKRPTEAEVNSQVRKSAEEFVQQAKNPTPEGQKSIQKTLDADQKYIERAEKLIERGELPGELRPDTHIKMKQKYLDGYDAMIKELRSANQSLKGARDVESLKNIADNRKAINYLEGRQKRLKSDIVNQTDNIKAMRAIEGPSGAFYKHQLKDLKKDVAQFQHDFFKQPRLKSAEQLKTQKVAGKKFKSFEEAEKAGEKLGKNPTKENIAEAAEATGKKEEKLGEYLNKTKAQVEEAVGQVASGKATEKTIQTAGNEINKRAAYLSNLFLNVGKGFGVGVIVGVIEEEIGRKIPTSLVTLGGTAVAGKRLGLRSIGSSAGVLGGRELVSWYFNSEEANKLKKLRSIPNEYTKHVNDLKKRYSAQRVNKIIKESKE